MKCSQSPHPALLPAAFCLLAVFLLPSSAIANTAPIVSNVVASQRPDDSKLVDIYYNLADSDGDACTVWVQGSDDGGVSWHIPILSVSGHVGPGQTPGTNKHIVWDAGTDMPGNSGTFRVRVFAVDGSMPTDMVLVPAGEFPYQGPQWTYVEGFYIDKYEVTVEKYCQFLNEADPDGNHSNSQQEIIRTGEQGSYSYTVPSGRGQYPVRYVSCYDAEAYAAWKSAKTGKSYRLPTEQEWEKAAGWDPILEKLWTYGFQQDSIDCDWCNYNNCVGSPREVGYYDGVNPGTNDAKSYYGCYDMSGNLYEWTSSIDSGSSRVFRSGYWVNVAANCAVTSRFSHTPSTRSYILGFRLVQDLD